MSRRPYTDQEREDAFWANVVIIPFHSCWEWSAYKSPDGYARFRHPEGNKKNAGAHRYAYSLYDKLIPGMVIDHMCRNKGCVNPAHLRQVTYKTNAIENNSSPPFINNKKTHCEKGHKLTPKNTGKQTNGGRYCKACKRAATYISVRKHYWKNRERINTARRVVAEII